MQAFTTGAYIVPKEIDGTWRWVVDSFEDSTFIDGQEIDAQEISSSEAGLYPSFDAIFYAVSDEEGMLLHSGLNTRSLEGLFDEVEYLLMDSEEVCFDNFEDLVEARGWTIEKSETPFDYE